MSADPKSALAVAPGIELWKTFLSLPEQQSLLREIFDLMQCAPLYRPRMPKSGAPFSVQETNFGPLGWVSDETGYRYQPLHPVTGQPWPNMPEALLALWQSAARHPAPPECCLVNFYEKGARMGLHQDRDEKALDAPVVSLSLGDEALFRIGGSTRKDPTRSLRLASGDVVVFGGPARLAFHGIDRVIGGTSTLLPQGGRLNLTLRRVNPSVLLERKDARPGG